MLKKTRTISISLCLMLIFGVLSLGTSYADDVYSEYSGSGSRLYNLDSETVSAMDAIMLNLAEYYFKVVIEASGIPTSIDDFVEDRAVGFISKEFPIVDDVYKMILVT